MTTDGWIQGVDGEFILDSGDGASGLLFAFAEGVDDGLAEVATADVRGVAPNGLHSHHAVANGRWLTAMLATEVDALPV